MLREDFLQQSAYDEIDAFCPLPKQFQMLRVIKAYHDAAMRRVGEGVILDVVTGASVVADIGRMRMWPIEEAEVKAKDLLDRIELEMAS